MIARYQGAIEVLIYDLHDGGVRARVDGPAGRAYGEPVPVPLASEVIQMDPLARDDELLLAAQTAAVMYALKAYYEAQ